MRIKVVDAGKGPSDIRAVHREPSLSARAKAAATHPPVAPKQAIVGFADDML